MPIRFKRKRRTPPRWAWYTLALAGGALLSLVAGKEAQPPAISPPAQPYHPPSEPALPAVRAMRLNEARDELTLSIEAAGEPGEILEIYYKEATAAEAPLPDESGWRIAATNLVMNGAGATNWTDTGEAGRGRVNTVQCRFFCVCRGDIDTDRDRLPDARERLVHGTSPERPDSDFDGLSDFEEVTRYGTDPNNPDTDGDGIGDALEVGPGGLGGLGVPASLPFTEDFESLNPGALDGQNDWSGSPTNEALVQSAVRYAGTQALELEGSTNLPWAEHSFSAAALDVVWSDLYAQPARHSGDAPSLETNASAAFYVDNDGRLTVYDGTPGSENWVTLTNHTPIAASTWARFTLKQEFTNQTWSLWLDGVPVAAELGFATNIAQEYTFCKVTGGSARSTFVDEIQVSEQEPAGLDDDQDGMGNLWEDLYGLDRNDPADAAGDLDADGLTNLQEYQLGAVPTNTDTDADGMGDGLEWSYGYDPAQYTAYARLPFAEDFERLDPGDIDGQNGWSVSEADTVLAQNGTVHAGSHAAQFLGSTNLPAARHLFAGHGQPVVWSDLYAQPVRHGGEPPQLEALTTAAFYLDGNGQFVVYDGTNGWQTLSEHSPVATGSWVRITLKQDFTNQTWAIWLDDNEITNDLGFATNAVDEYSFCKITGANTLEGFLDDIAVSASQPAFDQDHDGLCDDWETTYFGGPTNAVASADSDSDGLTNEEEYQAGTDPVNFTDTDGDGLSDYDEINTHFTNPLLADTDGDGADDGSDPAPLTADQNNNPGDITVTVNRPEPGERILW